MQRKTWRGLGVLCSCLLQMANPMCLIPGLCPRCHTAQILKRRKTKVHICNTTEIRMDPLDRSRRAAGDPRDVPLGMGQQASPRFPPHVATPTDNSHAHHGVLSLVLSY